MYELTIDDETLRALGANEQRTVMDGWFRRRFEDPAVRTPYESREGGYQYIWGGPYDAREELETEFAGTVPEAVIEALADELSGECWEWARVPSEEDYDTTLYDAVVANRSAIDTFKEAILTVGVLLGTPVEVGAVSAFRRLLFANVITVLETFLADTFINAVLNDESRLERFVATNPDFEKKTVKYSEILRAAGLFRQQVKAYLLDVVWHNLAKVQAMYRDTFDLDMAPVVANVARAVPKRHDIVHRNGRTKEGEDINISEEEVRGLTASATELAKFVSEKMPKPFEPPRIDEILSRDDSTDTDDLPF